jgi:hypothetical protein
VAAFEGIDHTLQALPGHRVMTGRIVICATGALLLHAATRLSPELQSDQTIDANVRLPPDTHFDTERHAIGDEGPHTPSRRERPFA